MLALRNAPYFYRLKSMTPLARCFGPCLTGKLYRCYLFRMIPDKTVANQSEGAS